MLIATTNVVALIFILKSHNSNEYHD